PSRRYWQVSPRQHRRRAPSGAQNFQRTGHAVDGQFRGTIRQQPILHQHGSQRVSGLLLSRPIQTSRVRQSQQGDGRRRSHQCRSNLTRSSQHARADDQHHDGLSESTSLRRGEPSLESTTMLAEGTFEVEMTPEPPYSAVDGVTLARATVDKRFDGPLAATNQVHMLAARTAVPDSAGYVGLERVTGSLDGKDGSF